MYKNILASVELDENPQTIIQHAVNIAEKFKSKVWIVHISAPEPDFVGYSVGPQYVRDFRADELRAEHRQLQEHAENLSQHGIEAEALLIEGATAEMIAKECTKLEIDLLCIGHHQNSWLESLLRENTDFSVINKVNVPVLTIPMKY